MGADMQGFLGTSAAFALSNFSSTAWDPLRRRPHLGPAWEKALEAS